MEFSFKDRLKKFAKLAPSFPYFAGIFIPNRNTEMRAILIGTPVHCNLGDHLIAEQALKYIKSIGFKKVVEVPEFAYELFPSAISIKTSDIIFINGGGWMGDDYEDEFVLEDIILRFPKNNIIILPQTIHISELNSECLTRMRSILNKSEKVIITVREKKSYDLCINELQVPRGRVFLLPDIGLLRSHQRIKKDKKVVLFSLRDDVEKVEHDNIDTLKKYFDSNGYDIHNTSTVVKMFFRNIPVNERSILLDDKINEFSNSKIVVTDRLHSMILAIISGTKCIAFDNSTHKVSGVAKLWLSDCSSLLLYEKSECDIEMIEDFLETENDTWNYDFNHCFEPLTKYIRSIINGKT